MKVEGSNPTAGSHGLEWFGLIKDLDLKISFRIRNRFRNRIKYNRVCRLELFNNSSL